MFGYKSVSDYYEDSNGLVWIPRIHTPCLLLTADDDPFLDPKCRSNSLLLHLFPLPSASLRACPSAGSSRRSYVWRATVSSSAPQGMYTQALWEGTIDVSVVNVRRSAGMAATART